MRKRGVVAAALLFMTSSATWAQEAPADEEVDGTTTGEVEALEPAAEEPAAEEPAAEEPAAEEPVAEEDLEADMEAAKEEIDAGGFEEIRAAPVSEAASVERAAESDLPASVRLTEGDADKTWGMLVLMSHAFGSSVFLSDDTLRGTYGYVGQSWDLRPSYKFAVMGHDLKAMARLGFGLELTEPNTNPARRFNPSDSSLYLVDNNIFTEPVTSIRFTGGVRYAFPTSWNSINVSERWGALSLFASANRAVGPLYLVYSFGFAKNFNTTKGAQIYKPKGARRDNPNDDLPMAAEVAGDYAVGFNSSFAFSNSLAATYNFTDELSASYSVGFTNSFKYTQDNVNVVDERTSPYADDGIGRTDMLSSTIDVTYMLDGLVERLVDLPFSLMASVGLSASHPAQTANNDGIMWPFFYQAMAQSRAANNYANFYIDLMGVY